MNDLLFKTKIRWKVRCPYLHKVLDREDLKGYTCPHCKNSFINKDKEARGVHYELVQFVYVIPTMLGKLLGKKEHLISQGIVIRHDLPVKN